MKQLVNLGKKHWFFTNFDLKVFQGWRVLATVNKHLLSPTTNWEKRGITHLSREIQGRWEKNWKGEEVLWLLQSLPAGVAPWEKKLRKKLKKFPAITKVGTYKICAETFPPSVKHYYSLDLESTENFDVQRPLVWSQGRWNLNNSDNIIESS